MDDLKDLLHQAQTHGVRIAALELLDKVSRRVRGFSLGKYSRLSERVLLGGQPAKAVLHDLINAGVTGVINLRDEYDYESEVGGLNLRYLRLATVDNTAPSLDHLKRGVEFIDQEIAAGGSVYIHCWGGLGRGPTMAAAYLVSQGASPQAAWEAIRAVRPFIRPTQGQMARIEQFAATYPPSA